MDYEYLNSYFESFLEDKIAEDEVEDYRDLTKREYNKLITHIKQHELYSKIIADIAKWQADPLANDVMSDDLEELCLAWFEDNIELDAE